MRINFRAIGRTNSRMSERRLSRLEKSYRNQANGYETKYITNAHFTSMISIRFFQNLLNPAPLHNSVQGFRYSSQLCCELTQPAFAGLKLMSMPHYPDTPLPQHLAAIRDIGGFNGNDKPKEVLPP